MKYVALLRGIAPLNPNMHNSKLRGVFEKVGFKNVETVIASGNVLFESALKNTQTLETKIEKAIKAELGFFSTTIVRSEEELKKLAEQKPFENLTHSRKTYLMVTFLKNIPEQKLKYDRAVCTVVDNTDPKTPQIMLKLEKEFGKEITTRTWLTVERILRKFENL
jgi:uncharacterized protein (DUF1697 family)